jgi:V/A-type H+/Na+-transporting ATPase subunit F
MDFYVIADRDTVTGFKLAGVDGYATDNARDAAAALDRIAEESPDRIVIITEPLADEMEEQIDEIRYSQERPLIVTIPGPEGGEMDDDALMRTIRMATGLHND